MPRPSKGGQAEGPISPISVHAFCAPIQDSAQLSALNWVNIPRRCGSCRTCPAL